MLVTGETTCEKCGNIMKWEFQVENHKYCFQLDRKDYNKYHPETPVKMANGQYLFSLECKECGHMNYLAYSSDIELTN